MGRTSVHVRPARSEDLPALLRLADELRDALLPLPSSSRPGARPGVESRYAEALEDPDRHLVVAVDGDDLPLGMALFTVASANALLDLPAVHMSHAVVSRRNERRGAGKALVAACAAFAEERGLDQIVVSVHPGSRDANRFFARLGFAPLAVRRVAPVAVVRRRLAPDVRPTGDHVVRPRARRAGRLLRGAPAVPLGPAAGDEPAS